LRMLGDEPRERLHRGLLLGRFLRPPLAAAVRPAGDRDLRHEALLVVRPALLDDGVARRLAEEALRHLLESRLVVTEPYPEVLGDVAREVALDDRARRLVTGVEIHRAQHGLVRGGE